MCQQCQRFPCQEQAAYILAVTSWWVLAYEVAYFLGQLKYEVMGNVLGPNAKSFLIQQPTTTNQKPTVMSFAVFLCLKVCTDTTKNSRNLLKMNRLHILT